MSAVRFEPPAFRPGIGQSRCPTPPRRAERSNPSGDSRAQQWSAGACATLVAPLAEVNTKFKPARGNYLKDKTFISAAKQQKRVREHQARNNARQQAVSKPRNRKQLRQAADKPAGVAAGEAVRKRKAPAAGSRARPAKLSRQCCNGPAAEVTAEGFEPPASRLRVRRPPLRPIWCQKAGRSNLSGGRWKS